jgi:hypothetical protein
MEDMIGEMVTTDLKIAQSIRLLKDHGYDDKFLLEK